MTVAGEWRSGLRAIRWKGGAFLGIAAAACWFYAAPSMVAKRIRASVEEPRTSADIIASRVDFTQVNARLADSLRAAAGGGLSSEGFSHLLLHGWLPRQRRDTLGARPVAGLSARAGQSQLYHVRYKALDRVIATFWDAKQIHEVILTLERKSVLHPWRVTGVAQHNSCTYDFDCTTVRLADLPPANAEP